MQLEAKKYLFDVRQACARIEVPLIPLSVMSDADAAEIDRVRDTLKELRREHFERVKLQLKGAGTG